MRLVHTLVLTAWVGPRPPGMESCHRDGDPTNNRVENLYWGTHSENMRDRERHGAANHPRGEANPMSTLSDAEVAEVRRLYAAGGTSHRKLAAQYDVSHVTIGNLVRGDYR